MKRRDVLKGLGILILAPPLVKELITSNVIALEDITWPPSQPIDIFMVVYTIDEIK